MKRVFPYGLLTVLLCTLSLSSCSVVPLTGRTQLSLISDAEINQMSLQQYRQFIHSAKLSNDARYVAQVERVGKRIASASENYLRQNGMESLASTMKWEFNTVESSQINAFCMPGGKIVVYTGLLKLVSSDDELAAVVGHEVSHAVAKHSNERLSQQVITQMGGQLVGMAVSKQSDLLQSVIGQAYGLGSHLFVALPYNRKQEYEADKMGQVFMAMAGYDPRAAIRLWQKMSTAKGNNSVTEFLSTHPSDHNRIKELEAFLPTALQYAPGAKAQRKEEKTNGRPKAPSTRTSQKWRF